MKKIKASISLTQLLFNHGCFEIAFNFSGIPL